MQDFFLRLKNTVQTYVWGSFDGIPAFTGLVNTDDEPMAELWMGAHPAAPSRILGAKGATTPLDTYIADHPLDILGQKTLDRYGPTFPFLFKVLSASNPLSLQVHPTRAQAQEGFARENAAGIPVQSPNRNYKDSNHKQEILLALTPFTAMCGFRDPAETRSLLGAAESPSLTVALEHLDRDGYGAFCRYLLELPAETKIDTLQSVIAANRESMSADAKRAFSLVERLFTHYKGDIGCLAPLYLNVLALQPGEVIYLPEGIMHTYIHGTGLELMSNSDNTLRGGLTAKHLDIPELLKILNVEPYKPVVLRPDATVKPFTYRTKAHDCELTAIRLGGDSFTYRADAPAIAIGATGEIVSSLASGESCAICRGSVVLIPANGEQITLSGTGVCYIASLPGTLSNDALG